MITQPGTVTNPVQEAPQMTDVILPGSAQPGAAVTSANTPSRIRKVLGLMSKLFFIGVFGFIAEVLAQTAGLDTSKPGVFLGALAAGAAVALWVTWGDSNKQEN
jgi:hypothetical protein